MSVFEIILYSLLSLAALVAAVDMFLALILDISSLKKNK